jgi:hypothetical protein
MATDDGACSCAWGLGGAATECPAGMPCCQDGRMSSCDCGPFIDTCSADNDNFDAGSCTLDGLKPACAPDEQMVAGCN